MSLATVAIIGTVFNVVGALSQASAQKAAAEQQAAIARRNAKIARQQAEADAAAKERENIQRLGAVRAQSAASGFSGDEGTAIDIIFNTAAVQELDKQNILYRGELRAIGFEDEAALAESQASAAGAGGFFSAGSALLSGAAVYSKVTATPKKV